VKNLIPWRRNRSLEGHRFGEHESPFLALHREMNRMFDDFARDMDGRTGSAWPQIELSETPDELRVVAELAGLEQRDVDMTLDEGVLTPEGSEASGKEWHGILRTLGRRVPAHYSCRSGRGPGQSQSVLQEWRADDPPPEEARSSASGEANLDPVSCEADSAATQLLPSGTSHPLRGSRRGGGRIVCANRVGTLSSESECAAAVRSAEAAPSPSARHRASQPGYRPG
jgi:HSP20 family molecular chaperone IbpA